MKACPACGSELSKGMVTVKAFSWRTVTYQDLWFIRKSGKKKIVPSEEQRRAFLCEACGVVCIVPNPPVSLPDLSDLASRIAARFRGPRTKSTPKAWL